MSLRNKWLVSALGAALAIIAALAHPQRLQGDFVANEALLTLWGSLIFVGVACVGVAILSPTRRK